MIVQTGIYRSYVRLSPVHPSIFSNDISSKTIWPFVTKFHHNIYKLENLIDSIVFIHISVELRLIWQLKMVICGKYKKLNQIFKI